MAPQYSYKHPDEQYGTGPFFSWQIRAMLQHGTIRADAEIYSTLGEVFSAEEFARTTGLFVTERTAERRDSTNQPLWKDMKVRIGLFISVLWLLGSFTAAMDDADRYDLTFHTSLFFQTFVPVGLIPVALAWGVFGVLRSRKARKPNKAPEPTP